TDAVRVLDQASLEWEKEKSALFAGMSGESDGLISASRIATLNLQHPWIDGVFVFQPADGLIYPPLASLVSTGVAFVPESGSFGKSTVMLPVGIAECRRMLEQPALSPAVRAEILLRLAGVALAAGATNQAVESLKQVTLLNPSTPPRDPVEGFYYDLIALKRLAPLSTPAIHQEILRRVLIRYDDIPPLQRDLMVEWVESQQSEDRGRKPDALDEEWRERMRGRELTPEIRGVLTQDLETLAALAPEEGWARGKARGRDILALKRGITRQTKTFLLLAIQFEETRLMAFLNTHYADIMTNSGIRVECGVGEPSSESHGEKTTAAQSPQLATRRLPAPMDAMTLTAYPSDPRAFFLNARLQSRLYRWSGLLLMTSIVAGVWLIWRQAATEIRQARERSDFAATVSHDLRTPLSSMRMLAESLYMGNVHDEPKKQKFLGAIIKESDRLSRLTDRALYFIRYGQEALRYRFTEGDLGVLVRNVVEVFAIGVQAEVEEKTEESFQKSVLRSQKAEDGGGNERCAKNSPRITLFISPEVPPIQFDGGAMEQVVFNLLDNAVKYSDKERGVHIEVSLEVASPSPWFGVGGAWARRAKITRPEIVLAVRDHGAGMAPEDVKRILKPYARGRGAAQRNARGIGLGLALCHHVVKAHGGRIQIESVPGQGSVFRVIMPVG
ncbi:MAG: HAMP domain-containing sensor histidine kinase, partial [bacterium]